MLPLQDIMNVGYRYVPCINKTFLPFVREASFHIQWHPIEAGCTVCLLIERG